MNNKLKAITISMLIFFSMICIQLVASDNYSLPSEEMIIEVNPSENIITSVLDLIIQPVKVFVGEIVNISAKLKDVNDIPIQDSEINFYSNEVFIESKNTYEQGLASVLLNTSGYNLGNYSIRAEFLSNETINGTSSTSILEILNNEEEFPEENGSVEEINQTGNESVEIVGNISLNQKIESNQTNEIINQSLNNFSVEDFIIPELPVEHCTPNWIELKTSCQRDSTIKGFYIDVNDCYSLTGDDVDKQAPKDKIYPCEFKINKSKKVTATSSLISKDGSEWRILKQDHISKYIDFDFVYINDDYYMVDWNWNDDYVKDVLQLCTLANESDFDKCINTRYLESSSLEIFNYSKENFTRDYFGKENFIDIENQIEEIKLNDMPNLVFEGSADVIGKFNPGKRTKGNFYIKLDKGFKKSNGLQIKFGFNSLLMEFNNSLQIENLTFTGNQNITRYLDLDKASNVTSAVLNLEGLLGGGEYNNFYFNIADGPFGVTQNGTDFWVTEGMGADSVSRYSYDGTYIEQTLNMSGTPSSFIAGITQNGTYIWVVGDDGVADTLVHRFTMEGVYSSNFTLIAGSLSITQDGTYMWVVGLGVDRVDQYYMNGTYTGFNFSTSGAGSNDPRGITKNNEFFWISDANDDLVYIFNSTGGYTGNSFPVTALGMTDVREITQDGTYLWVLDGDMVNPRIYQYYLTSFSTNPFLEAGTPDGTYEWNWTGEFNESPGTQTVENFSDEINNYLATCTPDEDYRCQVPLVFHSDTTGKLQYSNINIIYDNYPKNPSFDAGNDSNINWNYSGEFKTIETTADFSQDLQTYLDNETLCPSNQDTCNIPLVFNSTRGRLNITNLNISYNLYDTSPPAIYNINVTPNPANENDNLSILVNTTDNVNITNVNATLSGSSTLLAYNSTSGLYEGTLTAPSEGIYLINITVKDWMNLTTTNSTQVNVTSSLAELTLASEDIIYSPSQPSQNATLNINATIYNYGESAANNFKVELLVDGVSQANNTVSVSAESSTVAQFNWTTTSYGNHNLTINVDSDNDISEDDETNNLVNQTVFVLDSTPPTINNILMDSVAETNPLKIQVNATDNVGIDTVTVKVNGTTIYLEYNASSEFYENSTTIQNSGIYDVLVIVIDTSGLATSQQVPIEIYASDADLTLSIEDVSFSIWPLVEGESIQISSIIHNNGGTNVGSSNIELLIDGNSTQNNTIAILAQSTNTTSFNWTTVYGNHTLTIKTDALAEISESNETNNEINVSVFVDDGDAPIVEEIIIPDSVYVSSTLPISANVTDNINISNVNATIDGSTTNLTYNSTTGLYEGSTTAPSSSGAYNISIVAMDTIGLIGERQKQIIINSNESDLTLDGGDIILTPRNPEEPDLLEVNVTIRNEGGTDADNFVVRFRINGDSPTDKTISVPKASSNSTLFNWTSVYSNHTINITIDPADSISESDETNNEYIRDIFVLDIVPPAAPNVSASPDNWTTQTTHTISWVALNDTNGINHYEYQIDYGVWTSVGSNTSFTTPSQSEGIHTIYVRAVDTPGNLGYQGNVSIYIDNSIPNVPVLREWHSGNNWTQHNSPYYTWENPGDVGSGVVSYLGDLDGQIIELNDSESYHVNVSSGTVNFKVLAQDSLGQNSSWSNVATVYVDAVNPVNTIINSSTHSDNNTWYNNSIPNVTLSASDSHAGIAGFYYSVDKNESTMLDTMNWWTNEISFNISGFGGSDSGSNETENKTGLVDGEWYIHAMAKDKVGNLEVNTTHYKIKIDTTSPIIINITPDNNSIINESTPEIIVNYGDAGVGVNISSITFIFDGEDKTLNSTINEIYLIYSSLELENGIHNATISIEDNLGHLLNISWSFEVNATLVPPNDTHKFKIDMPGETVAWLGDEGNIVLKGSCFSGGSCDNPGEDSFMIKNLTGNIVAFINSTGDLCVETGDCTDQSASCNSMARDGFIVKNQSGDNAIYIDWAGDLCLTGELFEGYL